MSIKLEYDINELSAAFDELDIKNQVIYVTGNLGRLGLLSSHSKAEALAAFLAQLQSKLSKDGTIVAPTHSFSLCNTDKAFNKHHTPSETGPLTEFIRTQPNAVRQMHPFSSNVALGKQAQYICGSCSRHSYGLNTPFAHMLEHDAKFISVGIEPRMIVSLVHHCELICGVPYRYTKEFNHPIRKQDGSITIEPFYHFVTYLESDIDRNKNIKIFEHFQRNHELKKITLGANFIWSFSMREFVDSTTKLMKADPYCWLSKPPTIRPYQT